MTVAIRRARDDDVPFLAALLQHADVAPYLAAGRARDEGELARLVARSEAEPEGFGVYVIEVDGELAGTTTFEVVNRRSAIAELSGQAVHPSFRGRAVSAQAAALLRDELFAVGVHRLELEVYAGNERGLRSARRSGFTREGVRRRAYRRGGEWVDGIVFGLVREDLDRPDPAGLGLVCRHATVHVSALEPALAFYVDVLGLDLLERGDSFFAVAAGDVRLSVFAGFERAPEERARQTGVTLILAAPDVEAAYRAVVERGLEPLGGIAEAAGFLRFFSVLDPDGTLVSVAEYLQQP